MCCPKYFHVNTTFDIVMSVFIIAYDMHCKHSMFEYLRYFMIVEQTFINFIFNSSHYAFICYCATANIIFLFISSSVTSQNVNAYFESSSLYVRMISSCLVFQQIITTQNFKH